jgi:hypothetical protein
VLCLRFSCSGVSAVHKQKEICYACSPGRIYNDSPIIFLHPKCIRSCASNRNLTEIHLSLWHGMDLAPNFYVGTMTARRMCDNDAWVSVIRTWMACCLVDWVSLFRLFLSLCVYQSRGYLSLGLLYLDRSRGIRSDLNACSALPASVPVLHTRT